MRRQAFAQRDHLPQGDLGAVHRGDDRLGGLTLGQGRETKAVAIAKAVARRICFIISPTPDQAAIACHVDYPVPTPYIATVA